jgi:preprotein translocase subunit SecD
MASQLTLPGIAGLIRTIGMGVDSNALTAEPGRP